MQNLFNSYLRFRPRFKTSMSDQTYVQKESDTQVSINPTSQTQIFTHIFDDSAQNSHSQLKFFQIIGLKLLEVLKVGRSCTIVTYGGTACGKTYSTFGTSGQQGLFFRLLDILLQHKKETVIRLQLLEIYNQAIYDLSIKDSKELKSDSQVQSLIIESSQHLRKIFKGAYQRRQNLNHTMNNLSGRSVIQAIIKIGQQQITFIDLPGHQTIIGGSSSFNKQIGFINKMLTNFEMTMQAIKLNKPLIPYRNTLLTKININRLKDHSLFMITNINPFEKQSVKTLAAVKKFA